MKRFIRRYTASERINHWLVAGCFVVLAISGLGFAFPSLFWFTHILGTPQLARLLHPFIGVVMVIGFFIQFFRYVRHNFVNGEDVKWLKNIKSVLKGKEAGEVGRYNAGQKLMFWVMTVCMILLLLSGLVAWNAYFSQFFSVPVRRIALLVHSASGLVLIIAIITHVYAAIWVKGTFRAMIEGVVSEKWARVHHPAWYKEIMSKHQDKNGEEPELESGASGHKPAVAREERL